MKLFICALTLVAAASAGVPNTENILNSLNNDFSAKLFTEVVNANPGKSVVLSAYSVLTPLAQISYASVGPSHDELLKVVGLPNDDVSKEVFSAARDKLRVVKGVVLKEASRLYVAEKYDLNDEFALATKSVFGSDFKKVDFNQNVKAAAEINKWVEDQTNNRIKDLVLSKALSANTRTVLVNALYFKGSWKNKFLVANTKDRDFYLANNKTVKVPTMTQQAKYRYGESKELNAQLLELPYEGDESSLLVILPNEVEGLAALEEKLKDTSLLKKAVDELYEAQVEVFLPKFKIETKTDLKKVLNNLGLTQLFQPGLARLEKLLKTKEDLYISDAVQKAFIEVNEEGAEAGAANEFGIMYLSAFVPPPGKKFVADHPFVFLLKEGNTLLFNGVYQS